MRYDTIRYDTITCAESWVIIASLIYRLKPKKKIIRKRTKTSRRPYCHRNYHAMRGSTCTERLHLHNLRATQWIERLKELEHRCQTCGSCSKHFMVTVRVDSNYTLYNGNTNSNTNLSARPAPFSSPYAFFLQMTKAGPDSLLSLRTVDLTARRNTAIIANTSGGKISLYHRKL